MGKGTLKVAPRQARIDTELKKGLLGVKLYCKILFGAGILETSTADGKNPKWVAELDFYGYPYEPFSIQLMQKGLISDTYVAECKYDLMELVPVGKLNLKLPLMNSGNNVGELEVTLTWETEKMTLGHTHNVYYVPTPILQNQQVVMGQPLYQDQGNYVGQTLLVPQNIQGYGQVLLGFPPIQQINNQAISMQKEYKDISEKDDPNMKPEEKCIICLENKKAGAFYRCGHVCCCFSCGKMFIRKTCPVCRQQVYDFIKTFDT